MYEVSCPLLPLLLLSSRLITPLLLSDKQQPGLSPDSSPTGLATKSQGIGETS